MFNPFKLLNNLWDKVEESKIHKILKEFLLTVILFANLYSLYVLLSVVTQLSDVVEQVSDMISRLVP